MPVTIWPQILEKLHFDAEFELLQIHHVLSGCQVIGWLDVFINEDWNTSLKCISTSRLEALLSPGFDLNFEIHYLIKPPIPRNHLLLWTDLDSEDTNSMKRLQRLIKSDVSEFEWHLFK